MIHVATCSYTELHVVTLLLSIIILNDKCIAYIHSSTDVSNNGLQSILKQVATRVLNLKGEVGIDIKSKETST